MPTAGRHEGGALFGRALFGRALFGAAELMENGDSSNAAAVTEHGARMSRAPKQKSKRKTTIRKQLKGKEPSRQPGEKATQKPKA